MLHMLHIAIGGHIGAHAAGERPIKARNDFEHSRLVFFAKDALILDAYFLCLFTVAIGAWGLFLHSIITDFSLF